MSPFFHFSTESEKYISVCSLLNGKHFALPLQRVGSKVLCFKSGTFSLGDSNAWATPRWLRSRSYCFRAGGQSTSAALFKRTRAVDSVSSLTYITSAPLCQAFYLLKTPRREKVKLHPRLDATHFKANGGGGAERHSGGNVLVELSVRQ